MGIGVYGRQHLCSAPYPVTASAAFDRFLATAKQQDRMRAHAVRSAIIEPDTFPRDVWLGLTPMNDKK
jgi:hypothetical protein